jgi:hypothetical protein
MTISIKMNTLSKIAGISVVLALLAEYANYSSPSEIAVTDNGEISGLFNSVREQVQGKEFYKHQLVTINIELTKLQKSIQEWPTEMAKTKKEIAEIQSTAQREIEQGYREYPEIRPSASELQASELRQKADDIEFDGTMQWIERIQIQEYKRLKKIRTIVQIRAQ